ncbi:hypothetical protein KOR42_16300 [Thalassoglobus neptunius]|uniref:Uncharacterized protein n=1 Tax=Thalassoglobus neptunius TaxID=1938619 RepID=A0A5C5X663_9PLAN|nr:hypothetical protein [Thalassoglobus neptunius]TWT58258.1 hypothetical protein KOR42_16300 [Thalassoglobus neptunius]
MDYWVQYHNTDKLGYLPGDFEYPDAMDVCVIDTSDANEHRISTTKPDINQALGDVVFLVVGFATKKKRYALWSWTLLEEFLEPEGDETDAVGNCQVLNPPRELDGQEFYSFKKHWRAPHFLIQML